MDIKFYILENEKNALNKILSNETTFSNVRIPNNMGLLNISLIFNVSDVSVLNSNYCYIETFGRYYFIDDFESLGGIKYKFNLTVDVLNSYKDSILNTECLFMRGLKDGDFYSGELEKTVKTVVSKFESDITVIGDKNIILSTIGINK